MHFIAVLDLEKKAFYKILDRQGHPTVAIEWHDLYHPYVRPSWEAVGVRGAGDGNYSDAFAYNDDGVPTHWKVKCCIRS